MNDNDLLSRRINANESFHSVAAAQIVITNAEAFSSKGSKWTDVCSPALAVYIKPIEETDSVNTNRTKSNTFSYFFHIYRHFINLKKCLRGHFVSDL